MSKIAPSAADAAADKSAQDHPLLLLALRCEREEPTYALDVAIKAAVIGGGGMPKPYCTSLDAAVTLEDAYFVISVCAQKGTPTLVAWIDSESGVVFKAKAATEPMARCAAALRARAAMENAR